MIRPSRSKDRGGVVEHLPDDGGVGGAQDGGRHLLRDTHQRVVHDLEGHGIDSHGSQSPVESVRLGEWRLPSARRHPLERSARARTSPGAVRIADYAPVEIVRVAVGVNRDLLARMHDGGGVHLLDDGRAGERGPGPEGGAVVDGRIGVALRLVEVDRPVLPRSAGRAGFELRQRGRVHQADACHPPAHELDRSAGVVVRVELSVQIVEGPDHGVHRRLVECPFRHWYVDLVRLSRIADVGRALPPSPVRGHCVAFERRLRLFVQPCEQRIEPFGGHLAAAQDLGANEIVPDVRHDQPDRGEHAGLRAAPARWGCGPRGPAPPRAGVRLHRMRAGRCRADRSPSPPSSRGPRAPCSRWRSGRCRPPRPPPISRAAPRSARARPNAPLRGRPSSLRRGSARDAGGRARCSHPRPSARSHPGRRRRGRGRRRRCGGRRAGRCVRRAMRCCRPRRRWC